MIRWCRPWILGLVMGAAACADRDAGDGWSRRDSAGVSIVESQHPSSEMVWRLGDAPVVEGVGEPGAPETIPADPLTVFADSRGRMYVADGQGGRHAVLAYDQAGRYLHRLGEPAGPGRIGRLEWAAPYRGDSVAAFDREGARLLVFTPEGAFARELTIPTHRRAGSERLPGFAPGVGGAFPDGAFLTYAGGTLDAPGPLETGPAWYRHELLRLSADGARQDSFGEFGIFEVYWDGGAPRNYPYGATAVRVPFADGVLFSDGRAFELRGYDTTGALRRIFRREHVLRPVDHDAIDAYTEWSVARLRATTEVDEEALESFQAFLLGLLHPQFKPAISALLTDDEGNVWAEEFRWVDPTGAPPEPRPASWSVFGADGRWLAQVDVPAGFVVTAVAGGRVYGYAVGASGVRSVRAYPLLRQ